MAFEFNVEVVERIFGYTKDEFGETERYLHQERVIGNEVIEFKGMLTAEDIRHYVVPKLHVISGFGNGELKDFGGDYGVAYDGVNTIKYLGDGLFSLVVPDYDTFESGEGEIEYLLTIEGLVDFDFSDVPEIHNVEVTN